MAFDPDSPKSLANGSTRARRRARQARRARPTRLRAAATHARAASLTGTPRRGTGSVCRLRGPYTATPRSLSRAGRPLSGNQSVLGSLLLAVHDEDGGLIHAGEVGTRFTDATRRTLRQSMQFSI